MVAGVHHTNEQGELRTCMGKSLLGLLLHAWSEGNCKSIEDIFGGFVALDVETKEQSNLVWACLYVKVSLLDPPLGVRGK